ncbi:hypothetical protein LJC18_00335 [Lachnospiraceae bacterium OttesenSCG-928-E19]|nr:hypothetical protein [Lachnospiraceae bacterium OttesenSCG-928-E19]
MNKIYIGAAILAVVYGAYWAGGRIANAQCRADQVIDNAMQNDKIHQTIIETKRIVNETVITTGTIDIRMRLRDKYTIEN